MRNALVRGLSGAALGIALAGLAAAQPTPGVADYYVQWTLDADGSGGWQLVNPGFWTDDITASLSVHAAGSARVDVDVPVADPFTVSGTWDHHQEDQFTYTCAGNPVSLHTLHDLWTISGSASAPRSDFSIVLVTDGNGDRFVKDPFPNLPPFPSGVTTTTTASGLDCNGPLSVDDTTTDPNVGFPIFSTPGDIPSASADDTYFVGGRPTTLFLDPFNSVGVEFLWRVEIVDITACAGITATFYRDEDGDGYGNSAKTIQACAAPPGYVSNDDDCDDTLESVHPVTLYPDSDGDSFGDPSGSILGCPPVAGYVTDNTDCDDQDGTRYPGAPELCDLKDNDCDGLVDEGNPEGNEFCVTGMPGVCAVGVTVCTLSGLTCVPLQSPSAEVCDGLDNDCDGEIDEGGVCAAPMLTALSPAKVWIGLVRNEDAGIRFDLQAKVFLNNVEIASGQVDGVAGGGRGFANALLHEIPLTLPAPVPVVSGDKLKIRVLVRNACSGSTEVNGAARLWYNGQPVDSGRSHDAGSRFDATIAGTSQDYFLRRNFVLRTVPGSSRESEDQATRGQCGPFRAFETWKITLP